MGCALTMIRLSAAWRNTSVKRTTGDVSLHHTLTVHSSGPNRSDDWRIGIGISYIPTRVRHIGPTRLSATLARGTDRFNHFDHEAAPQAELDAAALAVHADSQSRYWQAASGIAEMRHTDRS